MTVSFFLGHHILAYQCALHFDWHLALILSIVLQFKDVENWLYGEGIDCEKLDYINKLDELKIIADSLESALILREDINEEPEN